MFRCEGQDSFLVSDTWWKSLALGSVRICDWQILSFLSRSWLDDAVCSCFSNRIYMLTCLETFSCVTKKKRKVNTVDSCHRPCLMRQKKITQFKILFILGHQQFGDEFGQSFLEPTVMFQIIDFMEGVPVSLTWNSVGPLPLAFPPPHSFSAVASPLTVTEPITVPFQTTQWR